MRTTILVLIYLISFQGCAEDLIYVDAKGATKSTQQQNTPFIEPYCECLFSKNKEIYFKPYLLWGFNKSAILVKDGKDIELTNIFEEMSQNLGGKAKFKFANKSITITGDCKAIKFCPHQTGKCDSLGYKGTVTISEENTIQKFPIWGDCGC